jgi:transposase
MTRKLQDSDLPKLSEALAQGLSCREAAARLGVSAATAIRWTKRCGLVSQRSRRLSTEARAGLRQLLDAGASPAEAAAKFGVSRRAAARLSDPKRAAQRRGALVADVFSGASLREAAARADVSVSTAGRWTREAGVPRRRAPRRREAPALAAMERGMSAAEAALAFMLSEAEVARLAKRPRLSPERLARRRHLFAALASGLSCRRAAALIGMPIATAIRWARQQSKSEEERE